ncbi:ScyD/ScyE family protein [Catellatospora sp. KI3]|uniref:ScyD/ScyE family protein n=1 Tax=Catellatospora sp. KI3 TaxID=3041620 RepID=UPI00248261AE|nr:ScyD/ScyE family protein [Catellatospora sp. KI3]MDI1461562.1 ScyD/ScyE family protein [Catellatospora sp. KI3]
MSTTARRLAAAAAVLLAALAQGPPAAAAAAPAVTVLYTGLSNPRGLAFDPDGDLYVAEAGRGADGSPDPVCLPRPQGQGCFGATGAVGRLSVDGYERLLTGLPSLAGPDGTEAIGPTDVAFNRHGHSLLTIGLSEDPKVRAELPAPGQLMGGLYTMRRDPESWQELRLYPQLVTDLGGHEAGTNPDGGELDSNPQSVAYDADGAVVSDAGANSLLSVNPAGAVSTLAVFPNREAVAPPSFGLPPGTTVAMQSVPMGVAVRDGAYYVAELTGGPFPIGGARVWRVVPDQPPTVYAQGLTTAIDLAFGPDGSLYVLEFTHTSMYGPERGVGALMRIRREGATPELVLGDINFPGGLTIRNGNAYLTDCSTCATAGRVLRVPLPR